MRLVYLVFVCVSERRTISKSGKVTANIHRIPIGSPMFAIKGETADHDTQTCRMGPHVELYFDLSFFMGCILRLYKTQGLFIISAPETDVTENSYCKYSCTVCNKKNKKLSFNLLKVHTLTIFYFIAYKYLSKFQVSQYHFFGVYIYCRNLRLPFYWFW